MNLQNLHNNGRTIFKFLRNDQGKQIIETDKDFFPYFYEESPEGNFVGVSGERLKQIWCLEPKDIYTQKTENSWSSDIDFSKRYMIDKVDKLDKCLYRWNFIDIENKAPEVPDWNNPIYPVSCVTIYDNITEKNWTYFLPECEGNTQEEKELDLFNKLIKILKMNKPDLLLAYNIGYDYNYMAARYNKITKNRKYENTFAAKISPVGLSRYGNKDRKTENKVQYPIGISIVDYLELYKKVFRNKKSYKLEYVLEEEFGKGKEHKITNFDTLDEEIKLHNIDDVLDIVKVEKKRKILDFYDTQRRLVKVSWEELQHNSKSIEMCLFEEAKNQNVILPSKKQHEGGEKVEGAFRDVFEKGRFYDTSKYDLSGAYSNCIIELCLDPANIVPEGTENSVPIKVTDRVSRKLLYTFYVKQNKNALMPIVVKKLNDSKNELKKLKNSMNPGTLEYEEIEKKYDAYKSLTLSSWGYVVFKGARTFNEKIGNGLLSTVRDLVHYTHEEIEKLGYSVIAVDTDGLFCRDKGKDISGILDGLVKKWAMDRFGKEVKIEFDYEGRYTKLFMSSNCHYVGYLKKDGKTKKEVKGMEMKRSSSSEFQAKFQGILIDKILDKEPYESIVQWVKKETRRMKNLDVTEFSFPCKIGKSPIWKRAYNSTRKINPKFKKYKGELFYYTYVIPKNGDKKENALAFDENTKKDLVIDWNMMIQRNITNLVKVIFDAMKWELASLVLNGMNKSFDDYEI